MPSDIGAVMEVQRRSPGRSTSAEFREHTLRSIEDGSLLFLVATVAVEIARAEQFRGIPFASGGGILFAAELR